MAYVASMIFGVLILASAVVCGYFRIGVVPQICFFLFFVTGYCISFAWARNKTIKLQKYWERCREMSQNFTKEMLLRTAEGDFQAAESFGKRGRKVLDLWDQSLKTHAVPKDPDLDDV